MITKLQDQAIALLKDLIKTSSFSREEEATALILEKSFEDNNIPYQRVKNNIIVRNKHYDPAKKTILLNSHHDTVKPGKWTYDPFSATLEEDKLIGLGSNDAGASLVSLWATFLYFYNQELPFNLVLGISAEEEISGKNGARLMLEQVGDIDFGIIGEPTQMQMAVAEKGLIVLDCETYGVTGHAARKEGVNALYLALDDIQKLRNYTFDKVSKILGENILTVTMINSGTQHNVIPDKCNYVVDIRTNELYNNQEVVEEIAQNIQATISPRSYHLNSSSIALDHPIVQKGKSLGLSTYGSPTLSDQSVMNFETLKIGPGDSHRSHTPDEYIYLSEIREGIEIYIQLLSDFSFV